MADIKLTRETIHDWLTEVTGLTVIRAGQGGVPLPRPEGNYITYQFSILNDPRYPDATKTRAEGSTTTTVTSRHRLDLSLDLNIYHDDGDWVMSRIKHSTEDRRIRSILTEGELSLLSWGSTRDLTELGDNVYRARHQSLLVLRSSRRDTHTVDAVNIINFDGRLTR